MFVQSKGKKVGVAAAVTSFRRKQLRKALFVLTFTPNQLYTQDSSSDFYI